MYINIRVCYNKYLVQVEINIETEIGLFSPVANFINYKHMYGYYKLYHLTN